MPQSQRVSSVIPFAALERPARPRCEAPMMLASIEPVRAGVDLHTFECAIGNRVLTTLAAYEDPMKSKGLGRWLQGELHPEEDKRLRTLALSGISVAAMAKQMKRSTAAVRNRAARLKIVVAKSRLKAKRQ